MTFKKTIIIEAMVVVILSGFMTFLYYTQHRATPGQYDLYIQKCSQLTGCIDDAVTYGKGINQEKLNPEIATFTIEETSDSEIVIIGALGTNEAYTDILTLTKEYNLVSRVTDAPMSFAEFCNKEKGNVFGFLIISIVFVLYILVVINFLCLLFILLFDMEDQFFESNKKELKKKSNQEKNIKERQKYLKPTFEETYKKTTANN